MSELDRISESFAVISEELTTVNAKKNLNYLANTFAAIANALQMSPVDALCTNNFYTKLEFRTPINLKVPNTFKIKDVSEKFAVKNCFINGIPVTRVEDFSINFNNLDDETNQLGIVIRGKCELYKGEYGVYVIETFASVETSTPLFRKCTNIPNWIEFNLIGFRIAIPTTLPMGSDIAQLLERITPIN